MPAVHPLPLPAGARGRPLRVLVAGGGVAALELVLALRDLAGRRADVTLLAPQPEFVVRPLTVAEPFGRGAARRVGLGGFAHEQGARFVCGTLARVDTTRNAVETRDGVELGYDVLVVATGAVARPPFDGAVVFAGGAGDVPAMRLVVDGLTSGATRSAAFVVPVRTAWPLPVYELALLASAHLRRAGVHDRRLTLVTPEAGPLEIFGDAAARAVRTLLGAQDVHLQTLASASRVDEDELVLGDGRRIEAGRVVTVPVLDGPSIPGLPCDARGFLPVDGHGRVGELPDVYAAGDVTTFPLKQGGLAAQQADAVAEAIADQAGAVVDPRPFRPVLRGLLLNAGVPVYLRAEPGAAHPEGREAGGLPPLHPIASTESTQALWWPPGKIAGRYLAPYLASARPNPLGAGPLVDRAAVGAARAPVGERHDAVELALILADGDAEWGDYASALRALEAAEALEGYLPAEYEAKRVRWAERLRSRARAS